jgi:hypothetical protein
MRNVVQRKKGEDRVPFNLLLPVSLDQKLRAFADEKEESITSVITQSVKQVLSDEPHPSALETGSTTLKFLAKAPCGDWREAIDLGESFTLSPQVAGELEAMETDVIVRAAGHSMEGARIHEGDLILMRPLTNGKNPRRNQITLVQVKRVDGTYESMIKHWIPGEPLPTLHDGDGKAVSLGDDVERVDAVAVAQGMIARF